MRLHTDSPSVSPKQHWSSLKNGDAKGLEALYKLYASVLYNYGAKFSPDKDLIKECIQELFVNIWTRRTFISEPADVKNYLFKSFRLSIFKKVAAVSKFEEYEETENYPFSMMLNMEETIINMEKDEDQKKRIDQALGKLSARQREAIFLKFYAALSYDEIAEVMGISVNSTYKIMARSLNFLKDNLSKDDLLLVISIICLKLYS